MKSAAPIPRTPAEARESHLESPFWRRALLWGLGAVPPAAQRATMPLWAAFFYLQVPHVRRAIESNLARLVGLRTPQKQLAAFRTFTNYCQCIANAYLPYARAEALEPRVRLEGREHLEAALRGERGAILATGHLGNWQLGPYFLGRHGFPPVTVVMTEEPDPQVQQLEDKLREGALRVAYTGRSPLLGLSLRAALQRGELVAFQMDRPSAEGGIAVPCLMGPVTFAAGPALLAWATETPVLPVYFPWEGETLKIVVEPPCRAAPSKPRDAAALELTCELAESYGRMIRTYPEQWFNFYEFWPGGEGAP